MVELLGGRTSRTHRPCLPAGSDVEHDSSDHSRTCERGLPALVGYAFQRSDGGKSAVVYYRRVGFMVGFAPEESAPLLGAVVAHEIGHALLPGRPHSKEGIMRPEWEAREAHASLRGQLDFSSSESLAMRNELSRWTDMDRVAR